MSRKSRKKVCTNNEKKFRVGIYARLSIYKESESIENQIEIAKGYFKNDNESEIIKTYEERGVSGGSYFRRGINELMEDLKKGIVNCVAVKDLSRLGRNFIETSYYIEKIFPQMNVRFVAVTDMYDSEKTKESIDLSIPFKNMINEFYIEDISLKITSALNAKRKGKHIGAIPYGYDRDEGGKLIPNEKGEIVKKIFEMRKNGRGYTYIADKLNEWGEAAPSALRYKDERYKKCQWRAAEVKNILENEVYLGKLCKHKTISSYRIEPDGKRKKVRKKMNKELYTVTENNHIAIIEK